MSDVPKPIAVGYVTKSKRQAIAEFKQAPSDGAIVSKAFTTEVKQVGGEDSRVLEFIISTGAVDREGDTIDPMGWELENFAKCGSVLWAHDPGMPPVARPLRVWVEAGQLKAQAQFADKDLYPFGDMIYRMYQQGFLRATSVGFRPTAYVFNPTRGDFCVDFQKQELLEFSCVPVPANPEALAVAQKSLGAIRGPGNSKAVDLLIDAMTKSAEGSNLAPKDQEWKGCENPSADLCAWSDGNAHKFAHHSAEDKAAVFAGVVSCMTQLLDSDCGLNETDAKAAYDHLAAHYVEFGEIAPSFKVYAAPVEPANNSDQPKALSADEIRAIVRDEIKKASAPEPEKYFEFDPEDNDPEEITREAAQAVIDETLKRLLAPLTGG